MNKALIAAVIAFGSVSMAHAADDADAAAQGQGKITFKGSIIDSPCSIAPGFDDQTIDLGEISKAALESVKGQSKPKNFSIQLENCSFGTPAARNKVQVTFSGAKSVAANGLLGITGTAKGASLAITDGSGALIELDTPTKGQTLKNGNNSLTFAAYLQADGASAGITEGDFQAVAEFTLEYS